SNDSISCIQEGCTYRNRKPINRQKSIADHYKRNHLEIYKYQNKPYSRTFNRLNKYIKNEEIFLEETSNSNGKGKRIIYYENSDVVLYLYGPGESGKSGLVTELFGDELYKKLEMIKSEPDYWDGYNGQDIILFDECDTKINYNDNENTPKIIASHKKGKYLDKESFVVDIDSTYNFYYKNQKFLKLEPRKYEIGHCGINGTNDYIIFMCENKKIEKIPNSYTCEFNRKSLKKKIINGIECFEIIDTGVYTIYRDSKVYDRITIAEIRTYYHNEDDDIENFTISYI
ncbi:21678_t:CDS:2, partial [Cetraspora pellucida]